MIVIVINKSNRSAGTEWVATVDLRVGERVLLATKVLCYVERRCGDSTSSVQSKRVKAKTGPIAKTDQRRWRLFLVDPGLANSGEGRYEGVRR
jgi:hypothetical protein